MGDRRGWHRVVNAMTIASPQQVMLKVRFLEVDRNAGQSDSASIGRVNGSGTRGVTLGQGGLTTQPTGLRWPQSAPPQR